jgi:hypothetical protein
MYTRREYPEKSWSFSKHKNYLDCKRSFYFNTFAHWNGWEYQAPDRAKHAYRLKKISNVYALSGQFLHEEIAKSIKQGNVDVKNSAKIIRNRLNKAVIDSRNNIDKWKQRPKDYNILHEFYYGDGVSKELGGKITARVVSSLENLKNSYTWNILKEKEVDIVEFEKENYPYFTLRDYKIFSILDLLYTKNGKYYIVDWKSGRRSTDENKRQMGVYALYVLNKYPDACPSKINGYNEYLSIDDKEFFTFNESDIDNLQSEIENSMIQMDELLKDTEKNIPLEEEGYLARVGEHCRYCNFIELCNEGLKFLKS